jgi:uncharacterized OsmC-like protein
MSKKLITDESRIAYLNRNKKMQELGFSEKGDELFISTLVAESEQIDNLHVKARINKFEIENDAPEELGGISGTPPPMQALLATYANCLEITALLYFSFSNIKTNSIKVKVEATLDKRSALLTKEAPLPGFYNITQIWYIDSNESYNKIKKVIERVEKICPVGGTFLRSHEFTHNIVLNSN